MIPSLFVFGKPPEHRYHLLKGNRRKSTVLAVRLDGNITSSHVNVLPLEYFRRRKKKTYGRYVFEIYVHRAGFLSHRNGKVCRHFFERRESRKKFRRPLKMEIRKISTSQINRNQVGRKPG